VKDKYTSLTSLILLNLIVYIIMACGRYSTRSKKPSKHYLAGIEGARTSSTIQARRELTVQAQFNYTL